MLLGIFYLQKFQINKYKHTHFLNIYIHYSFKIIINYKSKSITLIQFFNYFLYFIIHFKLINNTIKNILFIKILL
jgi:hypothetical protein